MTRYVLDWFSTNIDGPNTVSASGNSTDYDVSTPANVDGQEWFVNGGTLPALVGQGVDDPMEVTINFDDAVENLSFELFDVDANPNGDPASGWDDKITIIALDADGNQVPIAFTDLAFHHSIDGADNNVVNTDGFVSSGVETEGAPDSVGVNISGPIVSLTIIYDNDDGPEDSGIVGLSNIEFSTVSQDGYVEGTSAGETIGAAYTGDPDGDVINGNDAVFAPAGSNDDIVIAGGGDDTVIAGQGNDLIFGGEGEDTLRGGGGADTIYGDNPTFDGILDIDSLATGEIVQEQFTESGVRISSDDPDHQVMIFDAQNPTGGDADLGGTGANNVLILSEDGDSSDPDDNVDGGTMIFEFIGPATVNSIDFIDQGVGPEIRLYDEDGNLIGEIDVPAGADNTQITQLINTSGVFRMEITFAGSGAVTDLNYTIANDDVGNDDTIFGGGGADTIFGQAGDDTIEGQGGADDLFGGSGSDTFVGGTNGDVIVGGEDAGDTDVDVLDLTGVDVDSIVYDASDPEAGVVNLTGGGTITFSEIENVIPCFTPGTLIATPRGEVAVEKLQVGDSVITRDNGIQQIKWVGNRGLVHDELRSMPELCPILIKAGALGDNRPERDMLVSPTHRVLIVSELAQLYFDQTEVLVAAKHMIKMEGVEVHKVPYITYIHFMCQNHEIVLSDGAWTESFQPGDYSLQGVDADQREEMFTLFPELATKEGVKAYRSARRSLKKHEAATLFS